MTSCLLEYSLFFWLPVLAVSCQPQVASQSPFTLEPIPALTDVGNIPEKNMPLSTLLESCVFSQDDSLSDTLIKDLLLVYSNKGRDFMAGDGVDGYILRVIPISQKYEPVRIPAEVTVYLYENVVSDRSDSDVQPLCVWQINNTDFDRYWTKSAMLDGYTLPLHRDHRMMTEDGQCLFLVRMIYEQNDHTFTICNQLNFQDDL